MKGQFFRANVGVIVMDGEGKVLALKRTGRPDAWQLPQGGLDEGEEPLAAAIRELGEETGLGPTEVALVAEHPGWIAYELPPEARTAKVGRGQVQKWFLFRLLGDAAIDLSRAADDEFDDHKWTTLAALSDEVWIVRRAVYRELARAFAPHLAG